MQQPSVESQQEILLPLAEEFHSLQGEGQYTGTPMYFVRTAGCSVGKLVHESWETKPILKTGAEAWRCHTYDGRPFWCDTDFNKHSMKSVDQIIKDTWERHICITGGEPLIHKKEVTDLIRCASACGIQCHLETSGTIEFWRPEVWLTVSPKKGVLDIMLRRADEIKLLVDENFDVAKLPDAVFHHPLVYIQPINGESQVDPYNLDRCLVLLRQQPSWRLSVQLHKIFNWR